ncbi:MAG: hypothetical protein OEQ39_05295 [Gammaproteobacteria bacterium]|nr:hypothetical protein [Gammaproteobacteria bacterium]MDH3464848.1 hypothetical protein [Gammaproteobacteria bacterium]
MNGERVARLEALFGEACWRSVDGERTRRDVGIPSVPGEAASEKTLDEAVREATSHSRYVPLTPRIVAQVFGVPIWLRFSGSCSGATRLAGVCRSAVGFIDRLVRPDVMDRGGVRDRRCRCVFVHQQTAAVRLLTRAHKKS